MTVLLPPVTRPVMTGATAVPFQLFSACRNAIARYFVRREAIARLRGFSDAELLDIGLARSEIEPAVRGLELRLPDWPRR